MLRHRDTGGENQQCCQRGKRLYIDFVYEIVTMIILHLLFTVPFTYAM